LSCSANLESTACPGAQYGHRKHDNEDDGLFTSMSDITPALSNCVLKASYLATGVATSNPNLDVVGSYEGTCSLQQDNSKGCNMPETCEDTTLAVRGVIYLVKQAVRVGPKDESTTTPGCPVPGLCRTDSATAPGSIRPECRSTRRSIQHIFDGHSLPTGKGKPHHLYDVLAAICGGAGQQHQRVWLYYT
jgi:hypothetical protein